MKERFVEMVYALEEQKRRERLADYVLVCVVLVMVVAAACYRKMTVKERDK